MSIRETFTQDPEVPVEIHASPLPDQAWALLRQLIPPIVAFCVGKGLIDDNTAALIISVLAMVAPIIIGQLKTRLRATQFAIIEEKVDDSILTTKEKAKAI